MANTSQRYKSYAKQCDICQRVGGPTTQDEMPLWLVLAQIPFEKWAIYFIGPIEPSKTIQNPSL